MVSLADMIDKGTYMPENPLMTKLSLLKRAAELGYAGGTTWFAGRGAKDSANAC
jgi:hypothetical protein